jgi:2-polyprenyl-3-methyl-5-hydroxy-6-metoxy-1,4-benzoquinol methylase
MVHHNACPLCSSTEIKLQFQCTDYFVSREQFPVFMCQACNFRFTQDYPDEGVIGKYYESESYISHSDTSEGISNKLYRIARRIMLSRKKELVTDITGLRSGKILDLGSGTGYFAATMKDAGWRTESIEINDKARDFALANFGLETRTPGDMSSLSSDSYDCITLWHVLEHFHDPFHYASEIYRLLKPGAYCIIALPNSSSYDAEYYRQYWAAWDVPRHLWHFTPDTFKIFAQKTGLELTGIRNLPLDVFYISILSSKYKGSTAALFTGLARGLWCYIKTLFRKSRSSSVIYLLKKSVV